MVVDALQKVGAARSIVIDEHGVILAGNGVTEAAAEAGITKVRVIDASGDELIAVRRSGLTDEQKVALAIYDNRGAELAEWNIEQLVQDQANGIDLTPYFFAEELAKLLPADGTAGLTDPDEVPETRATDIVLGDLFELGRHRLICGDSTNREVVDRLLAGVTPTLTLTDPPYGVNYSLSFSKREGGHDAGEQTAYKETSDPSALLSGFLNANPSGLVVMTFPVDRHLFALASALKSAGFVSVRELVWVKDSPTFHPGATYQQQHEPILVCRRANVRFPQSVPSDAKTVMQTARTTSHKDHPTEKPQSVWIPLLEWHSMIGDVVYEPFSGSGSTIMTCEQINRSAMAIELEPRFVQVAIDRWEAFTGLKAVKVDA